MDISNFLSNVYENITSQTKKDSITPLIVGNTFKDLAELTKDSIESIDGDDFEYLIPNEFNHVEIKGSGIKKVLVDRDITIGALSTLAGMSGKVVLVQDDIGSHLIKLSLGNRGKEIVLNTLPRSITELNWFRDDQNVWFDSKILDVGLKPTPVPVIAISDYYDTLEIFHSYKDSDVLMSINNQPWEEYRGKFNIGAVDRPAGYWRFKIKEGENRVESKISYSLQVFAAKKGFPYIIPFKLK